LNWLKEPPRIPAKRDLRQSAFDLPFVSSTEERYGKTAAMRSTIEAQRWVDPA
jgi:hypothetical protein